MCLKDSCSLLPNLESRYFESQVKSQAPWSLEFTSHTFTHTLMMEGAGIQGTHLVIGSDTVLCCFYFVLFTHTHSFTDLGTLADWRNRGSMERLQCNWNVWRKAPYPLIADQVKSELLEGVSTCLWLQLTGQEQWPNHAFQLHSAARTFAIHAYIHYGSD